MAHRTLVDLEKENLSPEPLATRLITGGYAFGLAALGGSAALAWLRDGDLARFAHGYLAAYCWALSLALGALFFVLIQHVTRAGWSVVLRRVAESLAATLPILLVLALPILLLHESLYEWAGAGARAAQETAEAADAHAHGGGFKAFYLQWPFFVGRLIACFAIWTFLAWFFLGRSTRQDRTGDPRLTRSMEILAAPGLLLFALTVTVAAADLIMSLEPHWYSTIFGVYFFAGAAVGFFALFALLWLGLQRSGRLVHAVTVEHYHDIGKWLFAFTMFWAYIAFSQYMLIWYANIPEETIWFLHRQTGGWALAGLGLIFGHFLLPFCGLLSRHMKRNRRALGFWAAWLLAFHYLDLYWMILPRVNPQGPAPDLVDAGALAGMAALLLASAALMAKGRALAPVKDPRLNESLLFENA